MCTQRDSSLFWKNETIFGAIPDGTGRELPPAGLHWKSIDPFRLIGLDRRYRYYDASDNADVQV